VSFSAKMGWPAYVDVPYKNSPGSESSRTAVGTSGNWCV